MGKITKAMQPKHQETLSPWLKGYVESACTIPLPLLPNHLADFPSRWPFGRGDLYHWIPLLNRFDSILDKLCSVYDLDKGPQTRDFGCELLSNHSGDPQLNGEDNWREKLPVAFQIPSQGDRLLVESVLKFTNMLLEHCGNRSIYASSGHLNDLLNSTSWTVLIAALEVSSELAQRYQASVRRLGSASRQISSALLANHYNIDLERVQLLAAPFVKTPILGLGGPIPTTATPSSAKGKESSHATGGKSASTTHANDLVAVAFSDDQRWDSWGDVIVTYYPEEQRLAEQQTRADPGRSSMPSTPTPLRRSHTATATPSQSSSRARQTAGEELSPVTPRTPGISDESGSMGHKTLQFSQSIITSTPLPELVSRIPDDMPVTSKYEAFNRLRIAKALLGSQEERRNALAVRLLAITNLAYIHTEANFVEKVLRQDIDEVRRFQLVYQLAELIRPATDGVTEVPIWMQTIALTLLEAISNFNARCQDVLSALNANVNHGVLLYVIRKAVAGMKDDDATEETDKVTEFDDWRDSLFSLTLYLSMHTRVGPEMVSAGLMEILVEMLKIRSKVAQRHHSMVVGFLDGLIWTYQNAFTAFFNANGLDAVADLLVDTVNEARSLMQAGLGTSPEQQSSAVDYKIPYYQQQTLRWLLKFVHHIMSNSYTYGGNTDRLLRNLADKSELLAAMREVMADKQTFGSVDWTNAVTILSDFINNDPTSFPVIMESGMIQTYLEAITGSPISQELVEEQRATEPGSNEEADSADSPGILGDIDNDDRPHPPTEETLRKNDRGQLAAGILSSSEAINVVPQVLNSISLNSAGMKLVVSSRAFDKFLEIFESPEHVKCMEQDTDLASNVGGSFDELARHHPALRTSISNAIIDMVARVRHLGIEKSQTAGWGVKLLMADDKGNPVPIFLDGSVGRTDDVSLDSSKDPTQGDGDVDMVEATQSPISDPRKTKEAKRDTPEKSFTPYVFAASTFLAACMSNNVLKASFVEKGGLEILLDLCESPSLSANFGDSLASRVLGQVVSTLVEFSPVRGLPSLLNRAQAAIDITEPISLKSEPLPPYFAPFLAADLTIDVAQKEVKSGVTDGTKVMKAFLNAQTFVKIISECFPSSRSNALTFYPVNVYDRFLRLIKSIGPLLRGVLAEEAGQLTMVPQNWSGRRSSPTDGSVRGDGGAQGAPEQPSSIDHMDVSAVTISVPSITLETGIVEDGTSMHLSDQERASPRFQNYEVFRNLLHPMIPTTFPLFQAVGKALLPRRDPTHTGDMFPRPRQIEIAQAIADAVLSHLRPSVAATDPTSKDFHYWIIMLHTIHEMLIENPHPRHPDRSHVQLIMPVLLAFKEEGGLDVLNSMLSVFAKCVEQGDASTEESSKPKVAAFGLKKILDLYFILANGKYVTETNGIVNLQRHTDRSSTVPNIYMQFVVEIRAIMLRAIKEIWSSSVVERIPDQTAKRLIDVLKLISLADHEPPSTPKDKIPFLLLKFSNARFNWASARSAVEQLSNEYPDDLVYEAVFRANGSMNVARDYCRAHQLGIAGPRNPIPTEDADTSAVLEGPPTRPSRTSSRGTMSSDADRMSLDDAENMPEDNLGDLIEQSSQAPRADDTQAGNESDRPKSSAAMGTDTDQNTLDPQRPQFVATKEDLDAQRTELRKDLIDRCLDIIRTHPDTAMEVSDLISAMVIRQQNREMQDDVCSTLTFALSSLALDEEVMKRNGKCIASYAHLLALLLQDEGFFKHNLETLREKVEEYTNLVKPPSPSAGEDLPPWIPYILLVLELLLRQDERPVAAQWKPPKTLEEPMTQPIIEMPVPMVGEAQRESLLYSVLDLLPRIGKEDVLATSVLRILVILTRNRSLAKRVGEKKNLQRLFLMAKQLAGSGPERLRQSRTTGHMMTILRHIVEDEDVLRQVMRAEIKSEFPNISRGNRAHPDIATFLRHSTPLALRAPELFVEVANDVLEILRENPGSERLPYITLKEEAAPENEEEKLADTKLEAGQDVKPTTELADKDMSDAPKQHDLKRPSVENPDGVVHFLLSELVNYREVDDKEPTLPQQDSGAEAVASGEAQEASTSIAATSTSDSAAAPPTPDPQEVEGKEKKSSKPVFKPEEHPIFVYRCFLLNCLTELLQSYNRTKVEFINFKRSAPPLPSNTPIKPRSSVLNYLIYDLLCQGNLSGTNDTVAAKKKAATSTHTQKVLVALVSKTKEKPLDRTLPKFAYDDEESDLQFVRKFVLDTVLKAYEKSPLSDDPLEVRYTRMQSLAELMNHMVGERDRDHASHTRNPDSFHVRSQAQLRRMMYEKGFLDKLTSSIAEINLNFPSVKRAIKYILRVLRILTDTAKELSHSNLLPSSPVTDVLDDEIASASSLSDLEDDREDTPDLYRNSSLGMLEPGGDGESEDEDEDEEDLYGDEYDEEMEYDEEGMSEDEQDNISEDSEMGEIEGLPGDHDVVEVIMDGDDDEDDEDDSDEDDEDDDDDDLDSADMEDVEDRVEIVNEDGDPIDDDGHSDWESESDSPDDEELEDHLDYEGAAQDADETHIHGMPPPAGLLGNMARALMEGDEYDPDLMDEHYPDDALDDDDEEDEEDDMGDDEYIYDDDYPLDEQQPPMPLIQFEEFNDGPERGMAFLNDHGHHRRRVVTRMDNRSPFPPGFVVGGPGGDPLGDFRSYFSRHHRSSGPPNVAEDGMNPLLRRRDQIQDAPHRHGHAPSIGLRIPDGLIAGGGRRGMDGPMGLLGELMDILPVMGRDGQGFHFHIAGPNGHREARDMLGPRPSRHDHRREGMAQEPQQAVFFTVQSTMERYAEEARMLFDSSCSTEALKLSHLLHAKLMPAAIELEKKEKKKLAEEAEKKKRLEEERQKKEEEERQLQLAKEQEEKLAKEKEEAEAREAAQQSSTVAAAGDVPAEPSSEPTAQATDGGAMEGVEAPDQSTVAPPQTSSGEDAANSNQPRVMATIGNQEIDVTDLGIDPEYLAALPEEFREEVIAQTVSARRSQARQEASTGESPAAFQEFLEALPPQLRREIEQQEAQEQRRRDNNDARAAISAGGSRDVLTGDMDTASILLTFPPELREQVLLEQGDEIIDQLPPEMAEHARRLQRDNSVPHPAPGRAPVGIPRPIVPPVAAQEQNKSQRRTVVQMLDKAGVATLVRLMFVAQQGSIRSYLFSVFADVCENRQNRLEVISTILHILQEGSTDMSAVDRSFSHLSLKARRHNRDKEGEQKTPQSLKRTLTTLGASASTQINSETSPLLVVHQCLDLLGELCVKNPHIPWLFLTEHEIVGSTLKRNLSKKGKGKDKDSKSHKFAINSLLALLDRDLVMESSMVMNNLVDLLNRVTLPLQTLERRRKEAEEEKESKEKDTKAPATEGDDNPAEVAVDKSTEEAAPAQDDQSRPKAHDEDEGEEATKDAAAAQEKKTRQLQPPVIPPHNLNLVVRIFVARECSSKTFQNTISAIKNLSTVPGAKAIFGQELVNQARILSSNIVSDLEDLLPHIEKATSGTEIQGLALAKFSPGASEQNKLLRVLTALDHLFDGKKKQNVSEASDDEKRDLLSSLYHNSTFSAMWDKLGACLSAIHERENMLNVATILLPLIESLMVVCKNTTSTDDQQQKQTGKDIVMSSPPPESRTANLFFSFTDRHRRILNELVRHNPKLMSGTFALLVKNPKVLEFDNKRNYFNRSVHSRTGHPHHGRPSYPSLNLSVRRDQVFHDSYRSLYFKSGDEMKYGKLNIRFHGEEGVDAGGVTREWFQVLARQMFDPNYALFIPVSSDRTTFHPNKLSGINDEHLRFFKFIGRIIGKALYEGRLLDCFFSRAVYKRILGKSVSVKDMESFDPDYYKSLCWMLENDITDIITETFSVEDDEFGVTNVVDLIPGGRDIPVTEENKHDYVRLVVEHKLLSSVKEQMEHFLKGFHDIIPAELISIFNEQELELLISGLPDIDIDDWKSNTEYHNYTPSSPQIQWFWRALRSFDKEERAKLLQFVTGTSKVPLNGFKELEGMNGINRFNIHRDYGNKDRLPTSHTCFNQLDLPEYETYDALRSQLFKAITAGSEYFGFA